MQKVKIVKEPLFHITKRAEMPLKNAIFVRAVAIILGLVFAAVVYFAFFGANPINVLSELFKGAFGSSRRIWNLLRDMALLLGVGLALLPAFKMKFWNLGGNGQILIGALATIFVMRTLGPIAPTGVTNVVMILSSVIAGAIWAVIPAIFKAFFNANESLFTLMMNYIAIGLVNFFIALWVPSGSGVLGTVPDGHLPKIVNDHLLTILVFSLLTAIMFVYTKYSRHGYELSVVGESENTAKYVGISVKKTIIRTMALSGAICGVVGLMLAGSINFSVNSASNNNMGFTAIMVVWIAKSNPLIMIATSFFISFLTAGFAQVNTSVNLTNNSISNLLIGLVYFCVIGCEFFITYKVKMRKKTKKAVSSDFMTDKKDEQKNTQQGGNN